MRRFRFKVPDHDYHPMEFPPTGPFWCTGYSDTHSIVVAFVPDLETLTAESHWPDAEEIEDLGPQEIQFTDRFPKPDWWSPEHGPV